MNDAIASKVLRIVAEQAGVETAAVNSSTSLEELGIDSLGIVESIFCIEEEFNIQLPFNANDPNSTELDFSTLGTIIGAVEGLVKQQNSKS
ncbi:MAG: phosphopantetheine-binding protein [Rhodobacteraceae bacterium]|nr:phosphopantetheine-binding protein [Paracoccaceae bacterium]